MIYHSYCHCWFFNVSDVVWYNKEPDDKHDVKIIAIRCSNRGKETGLSINNMNTNYKYIITSFLLNTLLQHVGM